MNTYNYITRLELIQLLGKNAPLTQAHYIALDEYLEPYTLRQLGRTKALILLTLQEIEAQGHTLNLDENITVESLIASLVELALEQIADADDYMMEAA